MKISILIPSRNRPRQLSAVITALREMESGENEVSYLVGYDKDDTLTPGAMENIGIPRVEYLQMLDEVITIGGIWNHLASDISADIYSCMIDDAFPISPSWDKVMAAMVKQGIHAFSWFEVSAPQNVGYPTFTKEWLAKFPSGVLPEHFPFWWMDSWFAEMVHFVTNAGVPVHQQLALYSKQETTQNLRQVDHWWGFFNATRGLRLKKAYELVRPEVSFEEFVASRKHFVDAATDRDAEFRGGRIEQLEKDRGVRTEPSIKYLVALKNSQEFLLKNGLILWQNIDGVRL